MQRLMMLCFNSSQVVWKRYIYIMYLIRYTTFQFLIGSLEALSARVSVFRVSRFQFLIGSLEARQRELQTSDRSPCFNSSQVVWKRRFQITKHRLRLSFNSSQVVWKPARFIQPVNGFKFQFLIGSLEALKRTISVMNRRVSIPHRQSGSTMCPFVFFIPK